MKILTDFVLIPWGDCELPYETFQWFIQHGILYHPFTGDKRYGTQAIPYTKNVADFSPNTVVIELNHGTQFDQYYLVYPRITADEHRIITLEIYKDFMNLPLTKWIEYLKSSKSKKYMIKDVLVDYKPSPSTGVPARLKLLLDFHLGEQYTCPHCQGDGVIVGKRLDVDDYEEDDCPICEGKRLLSVEDYHDNQLKMLELKHV